MLNSVMVHKYGYKEAHEKYATYLIVFVTLYFLLCGHFGMFCKSEYDDDEEGESIIDSSVYSDTVTVSAMGKGDKSSFQL